VSDLALDGLCWLVLFVASGHGRQENRGSMSVSGSAAGPSVIVVRSCWRHEPSCTPRSQTDTMLTPEMNIDRENVPTAD